MLNFDMKRKINSLRDILVGKIPDPKSQVEQITIAMIYKFMDDMDTEFIGAWGGKRKYFANTDQVKFEKYAWSNIMSPQVSGNERSDLYREGIEAMNQNPNLPQLFRDIFRNAYIPFRDSETINMFLKEINDFHYGNSEDLGNAFEMLLSIMGSQGDAGQFRTPRHIIDMIVEIVEPQKTDSILDPACGTAGFLISAFKYILNQNKDKKGNSTLTPDDRKRLMSNTFGYDISQDMVRLSRVNMYLHNFPDPKIYEYDTLTSQDRWDDTFDVILANPPFMTPKGGINPHNRFSIQAKRSEVLFVDYIAEHLNPNGRAGVIVPEGIVFQSANAYKDLRKMLVDNQYLYAVISLPAGVFNPYSGVKTSILLMDISIAKLTDQILFVKIENDGFDLGAQRKDVAGSQLKSTVELVKRYKAAVLSGQHFDLCNGNDDEYAVLADKVEMVKQDYMLVGERYRAKTVRQHHKWPIVKLGDVIELTSGLWKSEKEPLEQISILRNTNFTKDGRLDFSDIAEHLVETRQLEKRLLEKGDIILEKSGGSDKQPVGRVAYFDKDGRFSYSNFTSRIRVIDIQVQPKYLWILLNYLYSLGVTAKMQSQTSGIRNLNIDIYKAIEFPLPPLSVQEEIVAEIEGYQKIIDGARQVVDNYRPTIKIDPEWPKLRLDQIFSEIKNGYNVTQKDDIGKYRVTRIQTISDGTLNLEKTKWTDDATSSDAFMKPGDILFSHINSVDHLAKTAIFDVDDKNVIHGINLLRLRPLKTLIDPRFALTVLKSTWFIDMARGFAQRAVNQASLKTSDVKSLEIPIPTLQQQKSIMTDIDIINELVDANKNIIRIYEKKIQEKISEAWDE